VGFSESVLYAHFENKQAVFEAVLARFGPQKSSSVLSEVDHGLVDTDPPLFLAELVSSFQDDWDREESRLFISLLVRDGLMHSGVLSDALTGMRSHTAELFAGWIAGGWIPARFGPPDGLALSFTGPIGLSRVLHLHADAGADERAAARAGIRQHVDLFTRMTFRPG